MANQDEIKVTASGATSSHCPDFTQIPLRSLEELAARFELGEVKHGRDNWRKGLGSKEYTLERISHIVRHCYRLAEQLGGRGKPEWDDQMGNVGAILWGGAFLSEAIPSLGKLEEDWPDTSWAVHGRNEDEDCLIGGCMADWDDPKMTSIGPVYTYKGPNIIEDATNPVADPEVVASLKVNDKVTTISPEKLDDPRIIGSGTNYFKHDSFDDIIQNQALTPTQEHPAIAYLKNLANKVKQSKNPPTE